MSEVSVAALRPLGAGEILDGAVRCVRRNVRTAFVVALPYAVLRTGLVALLELATFDSNDAAALSFFGSMILSLLLGVVLTGFLTPAFADEFLGRHLTAGECVARVGFAVWPLVGLAVVVALVEEIGLVALLIGGIWLWGVWAVAAPALVTERTGLRGALGRSLTLVKGDFWRTFWVRLLGLIVTSVISFLLALPFDALAAAVTGNDPFHLTATGLSGPQVFVLISAAGGLIAALVTGPISAAVDVLLYLDLRMRREGMDLVLTLPPLPADALPAPDTRPVSAW
ncbi:MAG TPA: hypothetical protein VGN18_20785 [Jatrophihabitans sp.]|jgi:hypothetical protein|uniref:hypothetical protein n=1 Tax=Jatrophihabitans sp. TaxID=1932789 RepID=UPI002E0BC9E9|nr:hypothetical protein [Jatrophihabitans sp.]